MDIFPRVQLILSSSFLALAALSSLAPAQEPLDENTRLVADPQTNGAWTLQWNGRAGRTYFLQQSHDLKVWTYLNTIQHGEGAKMHGVSSTGQKYFLRLRHTDIPCADPATADFDADGLNNADELFWLCDPFLADSDGDGFHDGWEVLAGMDPIQNNAANAHLDPDNDGWDNSTEHVYGTNPNLADSDGDDLDDPDDADPNDQTIDWPRAPEATRVWIPLTGYSPSTHGAPVALSNSGIALFEKAIWKAGVWKNLEREKDGPGLSIPDGPNGPVVLSTTLRAIQAIDLADNGKIVGKAELLFADPYGGDAGAPGTSQHAVQWTEDTNGTLVMELTGLNLGAQIDMATYWSLPKPAGVSPDGFLFTERPSTGSSGGSGGMVVSGMEWWRQEPTQWKGPLGHGFAQEEGAEYVPFEILGGVWMQARKTVPGGKMDVSRTGQAPAQTVSRLLDATTSTGLPNGAGYVCGALADNRVAFVSISGSGQSLLMRPPGNEGSFRTVPKLSGTAAFNARGEAISSDGRFWQNGKWLTPVSDGNTPPAGTMRLHDLNDHGVMLATAGEYASQSGTGLHYGAEAGIIIPVELLVDFDRNGHLQSPGDNRPLGLSGQGAYDGAVFRQSGAIVWANLDYDEENIADDKPYPDSVRFWHDGSTFEASHEDYVIRNGERSIEPFLDGYTPPHKPQVASPCQDIAGIKLGRMPNLPRDCKVLLRVARAEDLRAFHLYKRVPDFAQGDGEETAIWGGFAAAGSPAPPWSGADHVVDATTIDITRWVNENADGYLGHAVTRRNAEDPFFFGIEAMLYKGMPYDFVFAEPEKIFDGILDFSLILKDAHGVERKADEFRLTCLRLPAFPGAMGFGQWAQGGRGGNVYKVTNREPSGPGSLRDGIGERKRLPSSAFPGSERRKPLTIVFEVGGRIPLENSLDIRTGALTVAGQTAPGQGITLTDATFSVAGSETATGKLINKPNDTIIRYMRSRRAVAPTPGRHHESSHPETGYPMGADAFSITSASRVIVDHCSFSGGIDGTLDIGSRDQALNEQPEMDVTAQWCFVHHALVDHSKASLILGKFGARYSILRCFYGHNEHRNPEIGWQVKATALADSKRLLVDFSDNVVYNWKDQFCGITQDIDPPEPSNLRLQFLSNYYKPGDDTEDPVVAFKIQSSGDTIHFEHNRMRGAIWTGNYTHVSGSGTANIQPWPFLTHFQSSGDALVARDQIRASGGCSRERDVADLAYINEIPPGTQDPKFRVTDEIPAALVSSYPPASMPSGYADTDSDGMADVWEQPFAGQQGIAAFLPWKDADGDGWTNLEEYLNKTNPVVGDDPMAQIHSTIDGPLF